MGVDAPKGQINILVSPTSVKDIRIVASDNSSEATEWSRDVMRTQYEWLFLHMTVTTRNGTSPEDQDIIVYTVRMSRETWKTVTCRLRCAGISRLTTQTLKHFLRSP